METVSTWTRLDDSATNALGYENGSARILDNGSGLGSSKDSGRWAVEIDGRWIANVDTLTQAKTLAKREGI